MYREYRDMNLAAAVQQMCKWHLVLSASTCLLARGDPAAVAAAGRSCRRRRGRRYGLIRRHMAPACLRRTGTCDVAASHSFLILHRVPRCNHLLLVVPTCADTDMAARHRTRARGIQIIRTDIVPCTQVKRKGVKQFLVSTMLLCSRRTGVA